jgi:hypothetical protein
MELNPINKKIHEILISKGYIWRAKVHSDEYRKDGNIVFIYWSDHNFMMIEGRVATQKEFADATQLPK